MPEKIFLNRWLSHRPPKASRTHITRHEYFSLLALVGLCSGKEAFHKTTGPQAFNAGFLSLRAF